MSQEDIRIAYRIKLVIKTVKIAHRSPTTTEYKLVCRQIFLNLFTVHEHTSIFLPFGTPESPHELSVPAPSPGVRVRQQHPIIS